MADPVDAIKPWTIKSIATRTQNVITAAARRENLTVGQWVERRVDEWEQQGSPEPRGHMSDDLPALLNAAAAFAAVAKLPRDVRQLIAERARSAMVMPSQKPSRSTVGLSHKPSLTGTGTATLPPPTTPTTED